MRRSDPNRGGYVLLLTLGMIALAAIALAGLARHSLRLATAASQAASDLQSRWGLLSVRHVLLEHAAEILAAQVPDDQAGLPPWPKPARVSARLALGGQRFTVTVADEDSKLNLNTVYSRQRNRLLPVIRHLGQAAGVAVPDVRIAPTAGNVAPFASWGQVFDLAALPDARKTDAALGAVGQELTCWGSGRLNLQRASDAVLREAASLVLSAKEVGKLIDERKRWGGQGIEELLDPLGLRRPEYLAVRRLLATESRSYSLSVVADDGQRERSYFYVDGGRPLAFAW